MVIVLGSTADSKTWDTHLSSLQLPVASPEANQQIKLLLQGPVAVTPEVEFPILCEPEFHRLSHERCVFSARLLTRRLGPSLRTTTS